MVTRTGLDWLGHGCVCVWLRWVSSTPRETGQIYCPTSYIQTCSCPTCLLTVGIALLCVASWRVWFTVCFPGAVLHSFPRLAGRLVVLVGEGPTQVLLPVCP